MYQVLSPSHIGILNLGLSLHLTVLFLIYKFVFPKKTIPYPILIFIISLLPVWTLFRPGIYRSGDMLTHVAQLMNFYTNLSEGIFIPRWAGELCGTYGCPVFAFEYILPYYIGSLFHVIGFSFVTSIKLLLAGSFIASGLTMYFWAKEQFNKRAAFVAALFYLFAPYHLIDLHFRGSIGEVLSFVFIPLLFLMTKQLIDAFSQRYFFLNSLIIVLLLLSHSSTTIVVVPLSILYAFILWINKKKRQIKDLEIVILSSFFALLLSAFYWLPAQIEVKYTWLVMSWVGDFKPLAEYLFSPVLLGFLFQGQQGEYRLIIGYFHLLASIFLVIFTIRNKVPKQTRIFAMYLLLCFIFLVIMMLKFTSLVWEHMTVLHSFIMAWRLLVPIAFVTSTIAALSSTFIKDRKFIFFICFLVSVSTVLNWKNRAYVTPPSNPVAVETEIYTEYFKQNNRFYLQRFKTRSSLTVKKQIIMNPPINHLKIITGSGNIKEINRSEISHEYLFQSDLPALLRENTLYFPGWHVYVNTKQIPINYEDKNNFGLITFKLPPGLYDIQVTFEDTPIVTLGKKISEMTLLLGIITSLILFLNSKSLKTKRKTAVIPYNKK